jgi:hypothetical protein
MLVSATALPGLRGWAINDGYTVRASAHTYVRTVVDGDNSGNNPERRYWGGRSLSHLRRMSTS